MTEKKTSKALIMSDSCPVCKSVKEILTAKGLLDKVRLINASTPEGLKYAQENNVRGVPECVIIGEDGKQQRVCTKEEFLKVLEEGT